MWFLSLQFFWGSGDEFLSECIGFFGVSCLC